MSTWMQWGLCVAVSLSSLSARAEAPAEAEPPAEPHRRTVVLAHPGLTGQVGAGVEHAVGERVALAATVTVLASLNDLRWNARGSGFASKHWGLGVDPGVHVYLTGRAPEGLWVGPHVEVFGDRVSTRNERVEPEGSRSDEGGWRSFTYGASARVGYTVILAPGLSAQVALGLLGQRTRTLSSTAPGEEVPEEDRYQRAWMVAPRTTLAVGWAF